MYNTLEIEFLLFYLRDELEHVNSAIVDLERTAHHAQLRAARLTKRKLSRGLEDAARDWTHHHLSAS